MSVPPLPRRSPLETELATLEGQLHGFINGKWQFNKPYGYAADCEKAVRKACDIATLGATSSLADAYQAATLGALSCALKVRHGTGLVTEAQYLLYVIARDVGALTGPQQTAKWADKALHRLDQLRNRLGFDPHLDEEDFIALAACLILWTASVHEHGDWLH